MKKSIQAILKDSFIQNNIIFFFGSFGVAVLNYLYYPILGRIMSIEDFGEVQVVLSILVQVSILFTVFSYLKINLITNHPDKKERERLTASLEKFALLLSLVIFFLILIFSGLLKKYLQFQSLYPFVGLAFLLPLGVPLTFRTAYLLGRKKFFKASVAGAISAVGKTVFAVIFIYLGFRTFGAIAALLLSQILAIAYLSYQRHGTFSLIPLSALRAKVRGSKPLNEEIKKGFFIFVILISIAFLFTSDIIFVRLFFSPAQSGLYSGIATIARIIFFVTASISGVLLPSVKINAKEKNRKLLKKSFLLICLLGGSSMLAFMFFPGFFIKLLIGSKFLVLKNLLPWLSLSLFLTAILNLLLVYYIAHQKYIVSLFALVGTATVILLSFLHHNSLLAIIFNFIISTVLVMILIFIWTASRRDYQNA